VRAKPKSEKRWKWVTVPLPVEVPEDMTNDEIAEAVVEAIDGAMRKSRDTFNDAVTPTACNIKLGVY
jgi:hypothetical protein